MKLIDENEAILAGIQHEENSAITIAESFVEGVNFAEEKQTPLFQEYADWWDSNVYKADLPYHYCIKGRHTVCYKKENIFEQFLKSRS